MTGNCTACGRPPESHPPQQNTEEAKVTGTTKPAVRVMKARSRRRLACGHVPAIGDQIVGKGQGWRRAWVCMECALAETRVRISSEERRP